MVDAKEARGRAYGRSPEEQDRRERLSDPAKTWGARNPTARSGNPQNPGPDHPEQGDRGYAPEELPSVRKEEASKAIEAANREALGEAVEDALEEPAANSSRST